jgi:hypothetical protein
MSFENRKWVIIDKDEVDSIDFTKVMETSKDTLRYSVDGSKTFVKYEGDQPSFLSGKTEYNHEQILVILNADDGVWSSKPTMN